jgi:hypothetical protein
MMANEFAKFKNSRRRHKTDVAIARQVKIAKSHGTFNNNNIQQPHRLAKHHAMDCGNPECYLCGNPRKTHKDRLTAQEKRLFQDLDQLNHHHPNGITAKEQNDI